MTTNTIRFLNHYVTNGTVKAKVWYSLDNHVSYAHCVTLYARTYSRELGEIFTGSEYKNDTDSQVDYFDKGRVTLPASHPLYEAARAAAEKAQAAGQARRDRRDEKRAVVATARTAALMVPQTHGHIYGDKTCACAWCVERRTAAANTALSVLRSAQV